MTRTNPRVVAPPLTVGREVTESSVSQQCLQIFLFDANTRLTRSGAEHELFAVPSALRANS